MTRPNSLRSRSGIKGRRNTLPPGRPRQKLPRPRCRPGIARRPPGRSRPRTILLPPIIRPPSRPTPRQQPPSRSRSKPAHAVAGEAPPATEKRQLTSYIERLRTMFAEEEASGHAPPPVTPHPPAVDKGVGKPRNMPVIRPDGSSPPAANADAEESIEQYMSKLMQRLRGDRPFVPASQVSPTPVVPQLSMPAVITPAAAIVPHIAADAGGPANDGCADRGRGTRRGTGSRFVRACPQGPDSRAGNESRSPAGDWPTKRPAARSASRDARNIVARRSPSSLWRTLAGMTSLWLMLDAPDWRDMQFITACVSLTGGRVLGGRNLPHNARIGSRPATTTGRSTTSTTTWTA